MVEDKGLSELLMEIIYNEAHDSHDDHDRNDGWNDQDDPRMSHHLFIELTRSRGGPATGRCGDTHR